MPEINYHDVIFLGILEDFGEDYWTLRLTVPGMVPIEGLENPCAATFEENFEKARWTREKVEEIGINLCRKFKWFWEDMFNSKGEIHIDFPSGDETVHILPPPGR